MRPCWRRSPEAGPPATPPSRLAVLPSTSGSRRRDFGQLDDLGGKIAGDQILEGDPLQHRSHVGPQRDPDLEQGGGGAGVLQPLRSQPAHVGQGTIDDADDVGQGDLVRGQAQAVSSFRAALGEHDAGVAQLEQDVLRNWGGMLWAREIASAFIGSGSALASSASARSA